MDILYTELKSPVDILFIDVLQCLIYTVMLTTDVVFYWLFMFV